MNYYNWLFTAIVIGAFILSTNMTSHFVTELGEKKRAAPERAITFLRSLTLHSQAWASSYCFLYGA